MAVIMSLGPSEPFTGGSWGHDWIVKGTKFNKIESFVVSGNTNFVDYHEGQYDFSHDGWNSTNINDDYNLATGSDSTDDMHWWMKWSADEPEPFEVHTLLWDDDDFKGGFNFKWDGNDWDNKSHDDYTIHDKDSYDRSCKPPTHVSEPGTLLLLGSSLVGIAAFKRKFRG